MNKNLKRKYEKYVLFEKERSLIDINSTLVETICPFVDFIF